MRKKGKAPSMLWYLLISLLLLCVAIIFSMAIRIILMQDGWAFPLDDEYTALVISIADGVVAAIAAGLVLYQLKDSKNIERQQYNTEEAQFILEYNQAFIENKNMGDIEHYLECRVTGDEFGEIESLQDDRQKLVNYLVYLEGLASCIHSGILEFEKIDDLFAYRFFLAMNHPEVQSMELLPYGTYYRGCFQLYEKWISFRRCNAKYTGISGRVDIDIPLAKFALHNCYGYEKYLNPVILTEHCKNQIVAYAEGKKVGEMCYENSGYETVIIKYNIDNKNLQVLRLLLKEFIYNPDIPKLKDVPNEMRGIYEELMKTRSVLMQDGLYFKQFRQRDELSQEQLRTISRLIYETDPYIYPDMFGDMGAALSVLPDVFDSGKDEMFCLSNVFTCRVGSEIVGIVLWHEGPINWSQKLLRDCFVQKGKTIPPKLEDVAKQYVLGYSDVSRADTISILNLCVSQKARKFGIGTKLLQAFMKNHPNSTFELCVLSDNQPAIEIYKSCGFIEYGEEKAYNPQDSKCMRKLMKRKPQKCC